ncbi:uncharacterized protein [Arachis hypogaea]|uniref:uncharacterized protein n=1 Tax=Arachis hypogaea TaxID=3818 RepID=UPI003B21F12A
MANIRPHEPLKLYIVASTNTIGCMLVQDDENGYEWAIYYLSRVLTNIETRYSSIERLYLSLYYACTKLKCYMVAKPVKIIAQTDLVKYMLSSPMLRGRLGKWMLALTEFDLQYVLAKAVKGQVIANFLVDNSNNLNIQGEKVLDIKVNYCKLYFDGSKHKDGAGNEITNELTQIASRYRIGPETLRKLANIRQILVLVDEREALCVDEWEDDDWRKHITEYLRNPSIQVDRKTKLRAMNFVLMADELYKKGIDGSFSRCLSQVDKNTALGEVHEEICGVHQVEIKMKWVLCRNHVYWPSMIKDYIDYAKACQECQRHGAIQQIPVSELRSIIKPWPFKASKNINMVTSTPYYAQANGQVEAANKILIKIGTSPYNLVYGHDAVLPLEINLNTLRVLKQDDFSIDDCWNAMFDELNDLDSGRISALENMIRQKESIARSYNR